jgi:hypothetical protein
VPLFSFVSLVSLFKCGLSAILTYESRERGNPKNKWMKTKVFASVAAILAIMWYALYSNFTWNQHGMAKIFGRSEGTE